MMNAIDVLPYLEGLTGERKAIGKYRTGTVLMLMNVSEQKDLFRSKFDREYALIVEAEQMAKARSKGR